MTLKFKPGDRVRVYDGSVEMDGIVIPLDDVPSYPGAVHISADPDCDGFTSKYMFHEKQCRKLKAPRMRVDAEQLARAWNEALVGFPLLRAPSVQFSLFMRQLSSKGTQ
jgi:hypothetical protein